MQREPRSHRGFMLALAIAALGTVPFPFIGGELVLFWGLPLWLWWSLFFTTVLAGLTAWGTLRFWHDSEDD